MNFKTIDKYPKVSIIGACYNQEKYIGEAIESILNQSFKDFELILVDDASSDNSVEVIEKYLKDSRIKFIKHDQNKGISRTFNEAYENARGEYIAFMPGDDVHLEDKLKIQVNYLDKHPNIGAVFGKMEVISSNNLKINSLNSIFNKTDLYSNRFEYLKEFFYRGNFLPAPTEMIRKEILDDVGLYNPSLHNLQDFDNHVKVLLKHEIYVLDDILCYYRWHGNNTSAKSEENTERSKFETYTILNNYLTINSVKLLENIFGDEINEFGRPTKDTIKYFISRLMIKNGVKYKKEWGYLVLINFLSETGNFEKIEKLGFNNKEYLKLFKLLISSNERTLFIDIGEGFNSKEAIVNKFTYSENNEVEFNLKEFSNIQKLRFDPIESKFCKCIITSIDTDIENYNIQPVNALNKSIKGGNVFLTTDPQYMITGNFYNATYIKIKYKLKIFEFHEVSHIINNEFKRLKQFYPKFQVFDHTIKRTLFIDKGYGFNSKNAIYQSYNLNNPIKATYNLKRISNIKKLRFDPIEGHICSCQIINVNTDIKNFKIKSINSINKLTSNLDVFITSDPQYEISGNFANATYLEITYNMKILNDSEISKYVTDEINKLNNLLCVDNEIINQPDKLIQNEYEIKILEELRDIKSMLNK